MENCTLEKLEGWFLQYALLPSKLFKISFKMFTLSQFIFIHLADWRAFQNVSSRSPVFQKPLQYVSVSIYMSPNGNSSSQEMQQKMKKRTVKTNQLLDGFPFTLRPIKSWRYNVDLLWLWPQWNGCTLPVLLMPAELLQSQLVAGAKSAQGPGGCRHKPKICGQMLGRC